MEIRTLIFYMLPVTDMYHLALCSHEWYKLFEDEKCWQHICNRDYPIEKKPNHRSYRWLYESHYVQFRSLVRSSPGTYVLPDGHKYIGDWKDSMRDGYGTFFWLDGRTYHGEWRDDKRNVYGRYTYPDGTSYEGEWKEDSTLR